MTCASHQILLVGHSRDDHCDLLEVVLREQGFAGSIARIALEDLPATTFSWVPNGSLRYGRHQLLPHAVAGIYRRPGLADTCGYDAAYAPFVASESADAFDGALKALGVRWISDPADLDIAELKLNQLHRASALGLRIPRTVVTNDSKLAAQFATAVGDVIVKPVRYGLVRADPEPLVVWTTPVKSWELHELSGPPVVLQERIRATQHLRVVTVGPSVFIAALDAPAAVDWRAELINHERFTVLEEPALPSVREAARLIADEFQLGFTAQDWLIASDALPTFLELNPNGQWSFLDHLFEGRIGHALGSSLVALSLAT